MKLSLFLLALTLASCGDIPQSAQATTIMQSPDIDLPPVCNNDGHCVSPETVANCPHDCDIYCNHDLVCGVSSAGFTETHARCPSDCPPACPIYLDEVCTQHAPLQPYCAPEVAAVCASDSYCCNIWWDQYCINEIFTIANRNTCGGWNYVGGPTCDSIYFVGVPQTFGCGFAVETTCLVYPECCNTTWDQHCVAFAETLTGGGHTAGNTPCGDGKIDPGETPNNCSFDAYR